MRHVITKTPTFAGGDRCGSLTIGDVVEVDDLTPDEDGDVFAEVVQAADADSIGGRFYVAVACLDEGETLEEAAMVSTAGLRAALVAVGHGALADKVVRIAHAIEAAR